uniref:Uncharacterized protein n=1 Tax=Arundo donax TaxID=35708 RepID=A0A0A9BQU7_ARUDO
MNLGCLPFAHSIHVLL